MSTPLNPNLPQFLAEKREQNAAFFKALVESAFEGTVVLNQSAQVVYAGASVEPLLGYTVAEFVGLNAMALVHPDDQPRIQARFAKLVESDREKVTEEFRFKRKDGTWCWLESTGRNLLRDPNVGGVVCNFRDITARKSYETTLQHTQEWLRHALGAARMVAWEWDIATNYVTVSENAKAYGLNSGPVETFINLVHPEDRELVLAAVARATEGKGAYNIEFRVVLPSGRMRWARDQGTVYYRDGHPVRMLGVCTDITERRQVEQRLLNSESRFRRLSDANIMGVCVANASGKLEYANDAWLKMLGYSRVDFEREGLDWRKFTPPEFLPADEKAIAEADATGACQPFEKEYIRRDGSRIPVLLGFGKLEGGGTEYICAAVDLSRQKRLESELRLWAERLKEEAQHKDEFLAMLSHELRNPLAPIRNGLQILQVPQATPPQTQKAKEMMTRQIGHLTSLVDDLLDVSRISRGRILIRKERADLLEIVRTAVEDHRGEIESRGIVLAFETSGQPIWMQGDHTRLAQVMGNLLTNAVKFTQVGGQISVMVKTENGTCATVSVRDTGIGIETKILERLFQPFGQAPQPIDRKSGGLGLGLALVKGLIELHGGSVQATSEGIGQGAEFSFTLPVEPAAEPAADAGNNELGGGPATILIIEDNADSAESLQMMLQLSGHSVSVAFTGEQGVKVALAQKPQIVLCDIGLPDIDGFQVARRIRAGLPQVALVAVSGYGQKADKELAAAAGFDRHLTKPVDPVILEQVLATVHT